jgi:hypothetical protein
MLNESLSNETVDATPLWPNMTEPLTPKVIEGVTTVHDGWGIIAALVALLFFVVILGIVLILGPMCIPRQSVRRVRSFVADPERIKRRNQTIQDWVITKQVMDHEVCCNKLLHGESLTQSSGLSCEHHDDGDIDYATNECFICMEEFRVGEDVSWSFCRHVYHRDCIQKWLLRKKGCPYCRRTMLLVDDCALPLDKTTLQELMTKRQNREKSTFFCNQDGLVLIRQESLQDLESEGSYIEVSSQVNVAVEEPPIDKQLTSIAPLDRV